METGMESLRSLIRRRQMQVRTARDYVNLLLWILLLAGGVVFLLTRVLLVLPLRGNDMFPALKDGDVLVAVRAAGAYDKKDVVVYKSQGQWRVGRVIAQEGDLVSIDETGVLRVNGTALSGEIFYPTDGGTVLTYPYRVAKDCIFLLGDCRTESTDSRQLGAIAREQVAAKVVTLVRHRGI